MSKLIINTGSAPNDGAGDSLRDGADKINANFTEVYGALGPSTTLSVGFGRTVIGISATTFNVGIGTTNPTSKLYVVGNEYVAGNTYVTGVITATTFYGDGSNLTGLVPNTVSTSTTTTPQFIAFLITNSGTTTSILTSSILTYIPSNGNLGIGTTNPRATLNVVPTSTSTAGLFSGTTSNDLVKITQLGTGNALVIEDELNPDASPFVISGIGSVGIGTTNPSAKLSVVNRGSPLSLPNAIADFTDTTNSYLQLNLRNTSSGDTASTDIILTSDIGTDTANFIDFGVNNSGFLPSASWSINGANDGYLYSASNNLSLGSAGITSYVSIFTGGLSSTNERIRVISTGNVGIASTIPTSKLDVVGDAKIIGITTANGYTAGAGTNSIAPLQFTAGQLLTGNGTLGAVEYDGQSYYATGVTTSGRGFIPVTNSFRLASNRQILAATGQPGVATNFFDPGLIALTANGVYEIDFDLYFSKGTTGVTTFTLSTPTAPASINAIVTTTPVTGVSTNTPASPQIVTAVGSALTSTGLSLTLNNATHYTKISVFLENGSVNTNNLTLNIMNNNSTCTPLRGSRWKSTLLSRNAGIGITQ